MFQLSDEVQTKCDARFLLLWRFLFMKMTRFHVWLPFLWRDPNLHEHKELLVPEIKAASEASGVSRWVQALPSVMLSDVPFLSSAVMLLSNIAHKCRAGRGGSQELLSNSLTFIFHSRVSPVMLCFPVCPPLLSHQRCVTQPPPPSGRDHVMSVACCERGGVYATQAFKHI